MERKLFKWNKWVLLMVLAGFNLLVCGYLIHQVETEKNAYLSLRSEDGFLLMESLVQQITLSFEKNTKDNDRYILLDHLSKYEDLDYVRLETLNTMLYQSGEASELNLKAISKDDEIMEAIYTNQPFTRIISLGKYDTLECVWPFYKNNRLVGVLRLGLSLRFVNVLNNHFRNTTVIAIIFLILFDGLLLLAWLQSIRLARDGETFHAVMDGISDGVLIIKRDNQIIMNNRMQEMKAGLVSIDNLRGMDKGYSRISDNDHTFLVLKSRLKDMDVVIIRDITVENIAETNKEREKRMFSLGRLSSAFAHEIRNPLNAISMIVQQIESSQHLNDSEKQLLSIIGDEISRLNSHVDEYMNIARLPAIRYEEVNLADELGDLITFFRADADSKNIHISLQVDNNLKSILLDREKFRGIMINLIKNSMLAEASQINLVYHHKDPYGILTVSDNGHGMDKETREKAFDLYFTTGENGTGLGLPYVQRIMTAHGGMVMLESREGEGTDIYLYFPIKGVEENVCETADCG